MPKRCWKQLLQMQAGLLHPQRSPCETMSAVESAIVIVIAIGEVATVIGAMIGIDAIVGIATAIENANETAAAMMIAHATENMTAVDATLRHDDVGVHLRQTRQRERSRRQCATI